MDKRYQRLVESKALVWALLGVFLLGFGAIGLAACSDDSHQTAKMAALEETAANQSLALEESEASLAELATERADLETENVELRRQLAVARAAACDVDQTTSD